MGCSKEHGAILHDVLGGEVTLEGASVDLPALTVRVEPEIQTGTYAEGDTSQR